MSTVIDRPETDAQVRPARIAVVDDHESVRVGLKAAFVEAGHDFMLAAPNVGDRVEWLAGREVDGVLLALSLGDGSSVPRNVKSVQAIGGPVRAPSIADRVDLVREALAAGAAGVIPKSASMRTV